MEKIKINGCTFKYSIETDAFTQERTIHWFEISTPKYGGYSQGLQLSSGINHYSKSDLRLSFNIKGKDGSYSGYLTLYSETYKLRIGDIVSFLFSDSTIVSLTINEEKNDAFVLDIDKSDFLAFAEKELVVTRLQYVKRNRVEDIRFETHILGERKFKGPLLINEYTKIFLKISKEEFGWEPVDRVFVDAFSSDSSLFAQTAQYCYVYLMIDKNTNLYKIGMANDPEHRERTLQSEKPTIEKIIEKKLPSRNYASSVEKMLHSLYAEKRVRGEWFELSALDRWQIMEFLK